MDFLSVTISWHFPIIHQLTKIYFSLLMFGTQVSYILKSFLKIVFITVPPFFFCLVLPFLLPLVRVGGDPHLRSQPATTPMPLSAVYNSALSAHGLVVLGGALEDRLWKVN